MKYKNSKIKIGDLVFDSKREYKRFLELQTLEKGKVISNLRFKPESLEIVNKTHLHKGKKYTPDFSYIEKGKLIYEDSKSEYLAKTELWKLKHMLILDYCEKNGAEFRLS